LTAFSATALPNSRHSCKESASIGCPLIPSGQLLLPSAGSLLSQELPVPLLVYRQHPAVRARSGGAGGGSHSAASLLERSGLQRHHAGGWHYRSLIWKGERIRLGACLLLILILGSNAGIYVAGIVVRKIPSSGCIEIIGIEAYWDAEGSQRVTDIDWGTVSP